MIVDKPVSLQSYPRINATALVEYLRINTPACTHKHSCISYMTYRDTYSNQAPPVHNAGALNTAPPVLSDYNANRTGNQGIF